MSTYAKAGIRKISWLRKVAKTAVGFASVFEASKTNAATNNRISRATDKAIAMVELTVIFSIVNMTASATTVGNITCMKNSQGNIM